MPMFPRRAVLAGSMAASLFGAGRRAVATPMPWIPLIATEEAYATPELMAALEAGPPGMTGAEKIYSTLMRGAAGSSSASESNRKLIDIEVRLAEMDANGIDMHLLSITAPGPQAFGAPEGARVARQLNDGLSAIVRAHPTRFAGLAAVAPHEPASAVAEIRRARELGLSGVIINSHTFGEYLDEPKFRSILAELEARDLPLYLHPRSPSEAMSGPYEPYGLSGALWGFAADTSLHVLRMILGGVFDDFPRLQLVLGHMGEGIPYYFSRIDNRYRNVLRRTGAKLGLRALRQAPSEYFRTNIHITTSGVFSHKVLEYCIAVMGADRIMFAIDYPYERTDEAAMFIRSARLSTRDAERIHYRNAQSLFRIENRFAPAGTAPGR
jgi:2,3-dihydroxybenzoate decarboxylase